jgi:translation initiation factor 1
MADRLVFSTDPSVNRRCDGCGELVSECICQAPAAVGPATFTAKIRIETAGRGGKTVTVIDALPANADYLRTLARKLKTACGCGGTHTMAPGRGTIEIQGDMRPRVREILLKEGVRFKG